MLERLKARDSTIEVLFIGSGNIIEQKILAGADVTYKVVPAGKFRRYNRGMVRASLDMVTNWQNFKDFFKVVSGARKSYQLIKHFKPDVVFVKGGYVGLPVGLAAKWLKVPLAIHESDTAFGVTNKMLSRWAKKIAVGFPPELYHDVDKQKLIFTGIPVTKLALTGTKTDALALFKLDEQKPIIVIFGGSRGASALNRAVFENLKLFLSSYQVIHITGELDIEQARFLVKKQDQGLRSNYHPYSFLKTEMGLAYSACDVVVSRAGANSLTEIAAWAKPAIVVPLANSANNHQYTNALALSRMGAIRLLYEKDLSSLRLLADLERLLKSPDDMAYLSSTIHKFYIDHSADKLADVLIETAEESRVEA